MPEAAGSALSPANRNRPAGAAQITPSVKAAGISYQLNGPRDTGESEYEDIAMASGKDDFTELRIAKSEANTETKIARLEGKLDLVISKVDGLGNIFRTEVGNLNAGLKETNENIRSVRNNSWVIAGALALLIVALIGVLPLYFDWGVHFGERAIPSAPAPNSP